MTNNTSTPVKVSSGAANYTAATLDPDLRSQINTVLLRDGHVSKIQESLLHALNSHSSDWPTTIQNHALTLLRSGEVTTFPALLRRVLEDVQHDSANNTKSTSSNGKSSTNGDASKVNGSSSDGTNASLAVPDVVVEEALRATRDALETVCDIDENGA